MSSRTLYSVLAGINTYPSPVKPLEGCLYDVESWQQYLESEKDYFEINTTTLLNEAVTKKALASSLQNALISAKGDDVVFFFFSGHGTREESDPVFAEFEQDAALESLVCHDSIQMERGHIVYDLLSDKEIHSIISENSKTGTHILMIFDCCHSGGITRNAWMANESGICIERRLTLKDNDTQIAPMRRWDKFLFADKFSRDDVERSGWINTFTQKPHITFSACQNDESAYEQNGKGIFTSHLIDILKRTKGSISYYDLQSRARLFTQNQFRQTPEAYVIREHEKDLLRNFLDKTTPASSFGCNVYYKINTGWVMDLGALHGITLYSGPVILDIGGGKKELSLREVLSNFTKLDIGEETEKMMDRETAYNAFIENHFSGNTSFFILDGTNHQVLLNQLQNQSAKWIKENHTPFTLSESRMNATYLIKATEEKLMICQNDELMRPATQILLSDADPVNRCLECMRHISQWEYIRTLANPDFQQNEYPITMSFYKINRDHQKQELIARGDTIEFNYEMDQGEEWSGKIKVSVTNNSRTKYYCSILYLSNLFQVYGNILDGKVIGLNGGETAWINNGDTMELELEPHVVEFDYPHSVFYLKLIAGKKVFQVESLEQSSLPAPGVRIARGENTKNARGIKTRKERPERNVSWFTRTVCFKGRNPHYKTTKLITQ